MGVAIFIGILVSAVAVVAVVLFMRSRRPKSPMAKGKNVSSIGQSQPLAPHLDQDAPVSTSSVTSGSGKATENVNNRFIAMLVVVAGVFTALAARLWGMQVLDSETYVEQANENQLTTIKTPAARGRIFDRDGIELVGNKTVPTVLADADVIDDRNVLKRLSVLLGIPYNVVRQRIQSTTNGAQARRTVVSGLRDRDIAYLEEHPDAFTGITVESRYQRTYPYKGLASQLLGYTGTVSDEELANVPVGMDYQSGDETGKSGVEAAFESLLAGSHGERVVVTDSDGTVHEVRSETAPTQGNDIYLTISARVQSVAEQLLANKIAPGGVIGSGIGVGGAVVAMEVDTGEVITMASYPVFDPSNFVGGISQDDWDRYSETDYHTPLMNRCIAGTYPAASTFKAFTGMAGLHYGYADTSRTWDCTGTWTGFGEAYAQNCWKTAGHGYLGFREAVVVSCDVVFYEIAYDFYTNADALDEGLDAMADYVKKFGFGSTTGVELAGEAAGIVPTPEWKKEYYVDQPEEAQWLPGDMTNMVIGQGNVLITPLQLACGYAGIATGSLPTPTVLKEVHNSAGETVLSATHTTTPVDGVSESELATMRDALLGVAQGDGNLPTMLSAYDYTCACKTGTGETEEGVGSYSWFAMYAPYESPKYVVTCVVEQGGSGISCAGPIALEVMRACIQYGDGTIADEVVATEEPTSSVTYVPPASTIGRTD